MEELRCILLNQRHWSAKFTHGIPNVCHSGKGKTVETVDRSVVVREEEGRDEHESSEIFRVVTLLYSDDGYITCICQNR